MGHYDIDRIIEQLRTERDNAREAATALAAEYIDRVQDADYWLEKYPWLEQRLKEVSERDIRAVIREHLKASNEKQNIIERLWDQRTVLEDQVSDRDIEITRLKDQLEKANRRFNEMNSPTGREIDQKIEIIHLRAQLKLTRKLAAAETKRLQDKIALILALTDTGSQPFKDRFGVGVLSYTDEKGVSRQICGVPPGWRVVEAIRQVSLEKWEV